MSSPSSIRIGVDIGGTFTDFVIIHPETGQIETFKVLSTPQNPAEAVLNGMRSFLSTHHLESIQVIHGSTVATNVLLERKGARTALITTQGFRDVLKIGRQNRQDLYAFSAKPLPPIIPSELRFEVEERVNAQGEIQTPLNGNVLGSLVPELKEKHVESVAVCLIFSFLNPTHEEILTRQLRKAGFLVSPSYEILPEYREYERTSTTAVNAYVSPILDRYLDLLKKEVVSRTEPSSVSLQVMQSNGGLIGIDEARRNGVRCILSGPAGGIVGASFVAEKTHARSSEEHEIRVITFDMGGTSTDVSLINRIPQVTTESEVGGYPISIPVLDIHTIGAGGGSLAYVDQGGAMRVGPQSAGADPGPACYGKGDQPTVTDANLVLGRLAHDFFLGGNMQVDLERSKHVLSLLGKELGLDPYQAALGVIEVANVHMERALRLISIERGHDPRRFTLLSFGGAGGLHASDLALRLGIRQLLIPPMASTLSAFGMLASNVIKDFTQTVMFLGNVPPAIIAAQFKKMVAQGEQEVLAEGIPIQDIQIERFLDIRYKGQSYELTVPWVNESDAFIQRFHENHQQLYGYARLDVDVEIVNLRVRAIGFTHPPIIATQPFDGTDPKSAFIGRRSVVFPEGKVQTSFYMGEQLLPGNSFTGPAVVLRSDTTILINQNDRAEVDEYLNLKVEIHVDQDES